MKKIITTLFISFIVVASIFAQAPQAFKYQAVVRDPSGAVIADQLVSIRIAIIQDSIDGMLIYSEIHNITTNQFGIIVLEIGRGTIETGIFEDIKWGKTSHFLRLELDENGGTNYQAMGTSELLSVPYAMNTGSLSLTSPNGGLYEVTVDNNGSFITQCSPMPSIADAGPWQDSTCSSTTLAANEPQIGNGAWSIVSGTGGNIADSTNPFSQFSGIAGNSYTLRWTITNVCSFTEDEVNISFLAPPTVSNAGSDQLNVFSPTTLDANAPDNGTGVWSIIDGTGGIISDPNDPASLFSGVADSAYTLRWTIFTICDTTSDDVTVVFDNCPSNVADLDGNTYNTIVIGNQCWMAENLNVGIMVFNGTNQGSNGIIEKYCYQNSSTNCDVYGGLYQWDEMMQYVFTEGTQGICPPNWHLPTDAEWCTLEQEVDSTIICNTNGWRGIDGGSKLQEEGNSHWNGNFNATNSSGFTALPGGYSTGSFGGLNDYAYFWTSSVNGSSSINRRLGFNTEQVNRNFNNQNYGFSVRCIKD
ncbi:MAG: FISUMP domain-containing protein [Bacteroidales bacterium]